MNTSLGRISSLGEFKEGDHVQYNGKMYRISRIFQSGKALIFAGQNDTTGLMVEVAKLKKANSQLSDSSFSAMYMFPSDREARAFAKEANLADSRIKAEVLSMGMVRVVAPQGAKQYVEKYARKYDGQAEQLSDSSPSPLESLRARHSRMFREGGVAQLADSSFPMSVLYKGTRYYPTGKRGTDMKTGKASREYSAIIGSREARIWVDVSGEITED